jgi:cephalosporin hydroxylase
MKNVTEFQQIALEWKNTSVLDLWHSQVGIHHGETYKGIGLAKFPQDLWSYEKLIYQSNPEVIVEIGVNKGGFTRWLYDRLLTASIENINAKRTVIGIDLDIATAEANLSPLQSMENSRVNIDLIKCDLLDENSVKSTVHQVSRIIGDRSTLIIEDSGHTYETTASALGAFSGVLKPGEWFIVEDTCVDIAELRESPEWPAGALSAVNEFLEANPNFERSLLNHMYTITCHPYGFLRKIH